MVVRGGIGLGWSGGAPNVIAGSCDVSGYESTRSMSASAAAINVPSGTPALVGAARGATGPPQLRLTAPNGTVYSSSSAKATVVPQKSVFAQDSATSSTVVEIAHPATGAWRVSALGGSKLTEIERARIEVPPTVVAGVGGRGYHRVLGYAYQPESGHSTHFVEEGPGYEQELGPASRNTCAGSAARGLHADCGQINFVPAPGPAGVRQIYAITTRGNVTTGRQLVAAYRAPAEPEPSEVPNLTVIRAGSGLTISWTASRARTSAATPIRYDVAVSLSNGQQLLFVTPRTQHAVTVADVSSGMTADVRIAAVRADDTEGVARALKLASGKGSASS
jgi:hypothetical protein